MPKIFIFQSLREKNLILGGNFNRVDSAYWRALGIQQFYLFTIAGYFDILRVGDVQIYFSFILKLFFPLPRKWAPNKWDSWLARIV